jgi:3-deoxy-manno-octulosonate cytidylyltransferase (CMP-KDO synthetase)
MIICIIPARLNSSRFPGKLLAMAHGKTILQRTYETALGSRKIDELWVATDDEKIAGHAEGFGAKVIRTSSSCQNGTERIAEALHNVPRLQKASVVINLQGDHPCTSPSTLDRIADELLSDPSAQISTAVRPIRSLDDYRSPHVVKCVFDQTGRALYFSRSPIPYSKNECELPFAFQHIGLYGYRTELLMQIKTMQDTGLQRCEDLEQLRFLELGYKIRVAIVEDEALGVDTPQDLVKLEKLLLCQLNTFSSPAASFHRSAKG